MSPDDEIDKLREVLRALGEGLPNILNSVADMAFDPKRVAAFATSTAEFYRQLREAGVPEDKAAELTKVFIERTNPMGPLGGLLGSSGASGLEDLDALLGGGPRRGGSVKFKIGHQGPDDDEGEDAPKSSRVGSKDRS